MKPSEKNIEPGDMIEVVFDNNIGVSLALVIKVWDFKQYCKMHDELMLEYDVNDSWDHWQEYGPLLDILHPTESRIIKCWAKKE